ncbi:MAG: hypothetical protein GY861_15005 [bacterium]|nr:hypothetical protein [bacterium]
MAQLNISDKPVSNIPALPAGTYPGVISAIWDVGVQINDYDKANIKHVHQILVRVEVGKVIDAEGDFKGKRYAPIAWVTVPKSYSDLSNLVKLANAANGRTMTANEFAAFDTDTLIGKNIVVSVGSTSGGKAKITGYSAAMEGMPVLIPELTTEVPEWVQKVASEAVNDNAPVQQNAPAPEDDLPF